MKPMFLLAVILTLLLFGCEREQRRFTGPAPAAARPEPTPVSDLRPGPAGAPPLSGTPNGMKPTNPEKGPYDENAWAVSEGERLYNWYNCVGCHAHGGGGMGPALMDKKWIYGSDPENIYKTIVEGRPNGMPAFGGKIPDDQVWKIVAYVRSLGGLLEKDVRATRSDHMAVHPSDQARGSQQPQAVNRPPSVEPAQ